MKQATAFLTLLALSFSLNLYLILFNGRRRSTNVHLKSSSSTFYVPGGTSVDYAKFDWGLFDRQNENDAQKGEGGALNPKSQESMLGGSSCTEQGRLVNSQGKECGGKTEIFMFIAIGSAPHLSKRRQVIRRTWLRWAEEDMQAYKFFTENPELLENQETRASLLEEQTQYGDLVFLNTSTGRQQFGDRGVHTFQWAYTNYNFKYLMKVDDDGFTCLPKITNELLYHRPRERFIWGKYWFRRGNAVVSGIGKNRMDENFMVLTRDIVRFIADNKDILVFDGSMTLAVNFAFWTHFLNLTVFDDRQRIDSQQHYETTFMHKSVNQALIANKTYERFCDNFIYSHHVHAGIMDVVYKATPVDSLFAKSGLNYKVPEISFPKKSQYLFDTTRFSKKYPKCTCSSLPSFQG